ncbi:MAG: phage portal protein family protein, partial [Nannocystaceae bacterium]
IGRGRGILEAIYFYHYAKGVLIREMLQLAEKLGQGMAIVEVDGEVIGSEDRDNDATRDAYVSAIEEMRARNVLVMNKKDNLRFEFPDASGWQLFEGAMRYLDDGITRLILGGTLPSGGGGDNGSFARSETEADSEEALIQFDRELQAECITDTLVKLLWDANYEQRVALGLRDAEMPKYAPYQEKKQDPEKFVEIAETALRSGVPVLKSEYYERANLTQPGEDDEVIEPIEPMMAGAAGGGFGGGGDL